MNQLCQEVITSSNTTVLCCLLAPTSEKFSANVYNTWGIGGLAFLTIPAVMTAALLAIFIEECHYIFLKGDSKNLINALLWMLATYPAIMIFGTVAIFVPRAVVYLSFIYNIFVAFALYKFYRLIMVFVGGTRSFIEKSSEKAVPLNASPCCCICCLPKVHNSKRVTETAKWFIQQNIILTPFYGALAVLLKSDEKLYSIQGVSASVYLSAFNGLSTLICMYGFNLLASMTKNIPGIEQVHAIKGKTICIQLTMLMVGLEGVIFNLLAQFGAFPCLPPLNFVSRRKVIFNYAVVLQAFFLGLLARYYFRRQADIKRQVTLTDAIIVPQQNNGIICTAMDAYLPNSLEAADITNITLPHSRDGSTNDDE